MGSPVGGYLGVGVAKHCRIIQPASQPASMLLTLRTIRSTSLCGWVYVCGGFYCILPYDTSIVNSWGSHSPIFRSLLLALHFLVDLRFVLCRSMLQREIERTFFFEDDSPSSLVSLGVVDKRDVIGYVRV